MKRLLIILCLLSAPVLAVEPGEILSDAGLETRARDISQGLRCPICQNESIDESSAPVARDLRLLVRERLLAGDSDAAVLAYVVARYGEFVLLRPTATGANLVLWFAGPAFLLFGLGMGIAVIRARSRSEPSKALNEQESQRIDEILRS